MKSIEEKQEICIQIFNDLQKNKFSTEESIECIMNILLSMILSIDIPVEERKKVFLTILSKIKKEFDENIDINPFNE